MLMLLSQHLQSACWVPPLAQDTGPPRPAPTQARPGVLRGLQGRGGGTVPTSLSQGSCLFSLDTKGFQLHVRERKVKEKIYAGQGI